VLARGDVVGVKPSGPTMLITEFLHRKMHGMICDSAVWCGLNMPCETCTSLQARVEAAARELSHAVNDARVAILPISGMVAGNRIEDAERALRLAGKELEDHQAQCSDTGPVGADKV
jgi:hypothetical protein